MDNGNISFACASCGKKVAAPARFAGRSAPCPSCGASLVVPGKLDPFAGLIGFNCRLCGTRMNAPRQYVGRKMKCPDCDALTVVPPPPEPPKSRRPKAMDEESYEVYQGEQPRGVDLARAAIPSIAFSCRVCQTHLSAEASQVGEKVKCPDCGAETAVPVAAKPAPARLAVSSEAYDMDAVEEAEPAEGKRGLYEEYLEKTPLGYRKQNNDETTKRRRDPDQRSASTKGWGIGLFDGVGLAFSQPGMLLAWLGLSLGLMFTAPLAGGVLMMLGLTGGMFGVVGAILMVSTVVFSTVMWVVVACAIYWAVLDDAAGGAQRVHGWPAFDFGEWFPPTATVLFAAVISAIPGAIAVQLFFNETTWPWPFDTWSSWVVCSAMLLFPVVVLSQLNESSMWGVLSPSVLRTMRYAPVTWVSFYASAFGLAIGSRWIAEDLTESIGVWSLLLMSPLQVFVDLLYAWLLGRLAWIAGAATPSSEASQQREQ